jgi:hypothetical protein
MKTYYLQIKSKRRAENARKNQHHRSRNKQRKTAGVQVKKWIRILDRLAWYLLFVCATYLAVIMIINRVTK